MKIGRPSHGRFACKRHKLVTLVSFLGGLLSVRVRYIVAMVFSQEQPI